jgi:hypothetical protein
MASQKEAQFPSGRRCIVRRSLTCTPPTTLTRLSLVSRQLDRSAIRLGQGISNRCDQYVPLSLHRTEPDFRIDQPDVTDPRPAPPAPPKKDVPIGAIVGGTLGGVALLVGIAFLIWWARFKTRHTNMKSTPMLESFPGQPPTSGNGSFFGRYGTASPQSTPGSEMGFAQGQLGMVVQSVNGGPASVVLPQAPTSARGRGSNDTHNRNNSGDTHNRTFSADSTFSNGLIPGGVITPWTPPEQHAIPNSNSNSQSNLHSHPSVSVSATSTPPRRKADEAARQMAHRQRNPPSYENVLANANPNARTRSVSNASSPESPSQSNFHATAGTVFSHPSGSQVSVGGSERDNNPLSPVPGSGGPPTSFQRPGPGRRTTSSGSLQLVHSEHGYPVDRKVG